MRIDYCRLIIGMAMATLERGQIEAFHDQLTGNSVTQSVERGQVFDARFLAGLDQLLTEFDL
jgi:hypothetical protein